MGAANPQNRLIVIVPVDKTVGQWEHVLYWCVTGSLVSQDLARNVPAAGAAGLGHTSDRRCVCVGAGDDEMVGDSPQAGSQLSSSSSSSRKTFPTTAAGTSRHVAMPRRGTGARSRGLGAISWGPFHLLHQPLGGGGGTGPLGGDRHTHTADMGTV